MPGDDEYNVFEVVDVKGQPDIYHSYPPANCTFGSAIPLIIDNGSYNCKVGWACDEKPRLIYKNVIAKLRGKKETEVQVGNDITNLEVVRWLLKTQFDKNVITHFDAQEQMFDYAFSHLGINTDGKVDHPILLTEAPCNPNLSRHLMSELLFECYNVPKLAFGIDALFSYNFNRPETNADNGLVISCGYQTTHILPLLNRRLQSTHCRRIDVGGSQMTTFMHRLLQIKYPIHYAAINIGRTENWISRHCHVAIDYMDSLAKWSDIDYYCKNVRKIQLPFSASIQNMSAEAQKERKEQQVRRLREMNAKRREEMLLADEEKMQQYVSVQELVEEEDDDETSVQALEALGFETFVQLTSAVQKLSSRIERTKLKMNANASQEPKSKRACPDQDVIVSEDLMSFVDEVRLKRQELLDVRAKRRKRRADMARRRTAASQHRMKIISQLAAERKKEDNFGANEEDWLVYKEINKEGGDTDSEEEQVKIAEYEQILLEHDPEFKKQEDFDIVDINSPEYYQLHLDTEQIRVPELLFQPSMMGFGQAGIAEVVDFVLKKFTPEQQASLTNNVFVTGAPSLLPGFKERLEKDLLAMRPFKSSFGVTVAGDPASDGWNGARSWATEENVSNHFITKEEYDEYGDGYFKEHRSSNAYRPTPKTKMASSSVGQSKSLKSHQPGANRAANPRTVQPRKVQLRKSGTLPTDKDYVKS